MRILVIDPSRRGRALTAAALRSAGPRAHRVELVAEAAEGLRRIRERPYDAVIAELSLGGLDPLALIRRGRALLEAQRSSKAPDAPEAPWIVLSGEPPARWVEQVVAAGASDYLIKPVDDDVLNAALSLSPARGDDRNRRAFLRGPMRHVALDSLEGNCVDISEGGLSWVSTEAPELGELVGIDAPELCDELELPAKTLLWARVRMVRRQTGGLFRIGGSFIGLPESTRRAIRQRVLEEQLRHPH